MAIQILGQDGSSVAAVDPTHKAQHVTLHPTEVAGSFLVQVAGTTAAAPGAAANLASFRWGDSTKNALIRRLRVEMLVTTASTAGIPEVAAYIARSFSASDTGGTAVSMAGSNQKRRTSLATSAINTNGDLRFATGGTLTAGTRTLDPLPILAVMAPLAISAAAFSGEFGGSLEEQPIVLAQNEGIVIQNLTALTAAIYRYHVQFEWDEVTTANW